MRAARSPPLHSSTGVVSVVGVAASASLLYLLEKTRKAHYHSQRLDSSSALSTHQHSSSFDHTYPLHISRGWNTERRARAFSKEYVEEARHQEESRALFPSLQAHVISQRRRRPLDGDESRDGDDGKKTAFYFNADKPIPIDNEMFKGTVTLVLRPLEADHDLKFESRIPRHILEGRDDGDVPTFYFLLKGKFKRPVRKDALMVGGELSDPFVMESTVSGWTRRWADLLLKLLSRNIGGNMSYSFGGRKGGNDGVVERPHIAFPVAGAMVVDSHEADTATTSTDTWDTDSTHSFMYCASSIDLVTWNVTYPFKMEVGKFWGNSPLRLVIYEKKDHQRGNNYLFDLQISFQPASQKETADAIFPLRNEQFRLSTAS